MPEIRAVIVMPGGDDMARYATACLNHVADQKYKLVGVMRDGAKALEMLRAGKVDRVVAATEAVLPAGYPAVEIVSRLPRPRAGRHNSGPVPQVHRSRLIPRDEG